MRKLYLLATLLLFNIQFVISQDDFITTWQTYFDNESIHIPTYSGESYNYDVDWGDGTTTTGHTGNATHTYVSPGTYTVSISGDFPRICFGCEGGTNKQKIISIDQWGNQVWTSMRIAFSGCVNLEGQASDSPNLSICTAMSEMFHSATSFNQDISEWDVGNVTTMYSMFSNASSFNQDIGGWNVSNVTDMNRMFFNASSFNQDIGDWNISNVSDVRWMFYKASSFNQDIGGWNVSNITDMNEMFSYASSFNQDLNGWDVGNVTDMNYMFSNATSFNGNINSWNLINVTNMNGMFYKASSFNQDISGWIVVYVVHMSWMFHSASSFNQDIGGWEVGSVTDMGGMFNSASSFNQDISGWDVGNVTNMGGMFSYATSFDQDIGNWDISNVSDMEYMFNGIALSISNYDALLLGWSTQNLKSGVSFDGGYSKYCDGAAARQSIIDNFNWNIDDGGEYPDCNTIPFCTSLTNPTGGSTNVDITTDLSWEASANATGYKLIVGTTSGGTDIEDNTDVGNVTTYDPGDFPCESNIYVTIIPYNDSGDATGCSEESFSTESVSANAGNDVAICNGGSTQLEATGGTTYSWSPTDGLDDPNISNPVASPSSTTTYTVTVSNDNGCSDTDDVVVTVNPNPTPNASATGETYNDANDGTATCAPSGGTPSYSYSWSNGESTQTITGLAPGNYTITVTDANTCTGDETVTVSEFVCPALTIVFEFSNPSCYQTCDGEIHITDIANGVPPFTYLWNNGSSESFISNLCEGDYSVTVTDSKNCQVSTSFGLVAPAELLPNASSTDETYNDANDGTATCDPTGGTAPYEYEWSNGEITQTIEDLAPGYYSVTVTDDNECQGMDTVYVAESICPDITVEYTKTDNYCFGDCDGSIEITNVDSGNPPYIYEWSTGEEGSEISDLCAGDYSVTIIDSDNCQIVKYIEITEPDELLANASSTNEVLGNDGTATCTPVGGTDPYFYKWSNGEETQTIVGLASGDYTVTVSDILSCESVETVSVLSAGCSNLKINATSVDLKCYESCLGSIDIASVENGTAPFNYIWSNGDTNSKIDSLCSGKYFVTVTDSKNCVIVDSFTIVQPTKLQANINVTGETSKNANDGKATCYSTGGIPPYTYKWSNGMTTQSVSNLSPGIYTLTLQDANGCTVVENVTISKFGCQDLVLNIEQEDISCFGECDGSLNAVVNKSIVITEIMYNSPDDDDLYEYIELYNMSKDTIQMKDYEFIDGIEHKFDSIAMAPKAFLILVKDSTIINNLGINGIVWDKGGLKNKGETIILANNYGEVIDSVKYDDADDWVSAPDGNGPSLELCDFNKNNAKANYWKASTNSLAYSVNGIDLLGTPGQPNSVDCNQSNIFEETMEAVNSDFSFNWSTGETTESIENLCAGIYSVTIIDNDNCSTVDTFEITEPTELHATISSIDETNTNTNDGTATVNPSGGTPPYSFSWNNGATTKSIINLNPGIYSITVTDTNECIYIDSIEIKQYDGCQDLSIVFSKFDAGCYGECTGVLSIATVKNAVLPLSYVWSRGDNTKTITSVCAGEYIVTITDANNCTVIDTNYISQPEEIVITVESVVNITENGLGAVLLSTNNNGNYIFNWTGPNGFSYNKENIINLNQAGCYTLEVTDTILNCSVDTTICIDDLTATENIDDFVSGINIYPNPNKGDFIIDFSSTKVSQAVITLYDISGKEKMEVFKDAIDKNINIEITNLKSGLYIIRIKSEKYGTVYKKVIVSE